MAQRTSKSGKGAAHLVFEAMNAIPTDKQLKGLREENFREARELAAQLESVLPAHFGVYPKFSMGRWHLVITVQRRMPD